eukprot:9158903-Lingulodinium_polyedra.AAC.1
MLAYRKAGRRIFRPEAVNMVSVVCDATRVAKKDVCYSALYAPEVGKALCPPPPGGVLGEELAVQSWTG